MYGRRSPSRIRRFSILRLRRFRCRPLRVTRRHHRSRRHSILHGRSLRVVLELEDWEIPERNFRRTKSTSGGDRGLDGGHLSTCTGSIPTQRTQDEQTSETREEERNLTND